MHHITVLDCTLRDGGYYTDWDYPEELVHAYIDAMDRAGVAYAEIGYRALRYPRFVGALGYSPDWYLTRLPATRRLELAVMIDAKAFAGKTQYLHQVFAPRDRSPVSLVRVATGRLHLETTLELVSRLHDLGYATTVNVMAAATLSERQQAEVFSILGRSAADVIYFADSFGSMYPDDVRRCADLLKRNTDKPWGVHAHNNLELAFSNALEAVRAGAAWVDASVTGMGRGPGNLKTELFMQHLRAKLGQENDPEAIYDFIGQHMLRLYERHRWGPGPAYLLSGFLGAHPLFAQQLLSSGRYSVAEIVRILGAIHASGRSGQFDTEVLAQAISSRHRSARQAPHAHCPALSPTDAPWADRAVLVLGRGPSALDQVHAINEYIRRFQPIVVECNYEPRITTAEHHFCMFVVSANAREQAAGASRAGKRVVLAAGALANGLPPSSAFVEAYVVRQGQLDVHSPTMTLPADVVSMLAIGCAVRCGARRIEVVGFDGYVHSKDERDRRMQEEMREFLALLADQVADLSLVSLTRTSFEIEESSVYGRLLD